MLYISHYSFRSILVVTLIPSLLPTLPNPSSSFLLPIFFPLSFSPGIPPVQFSITGLDTALGKELNKWEVRKS